METIKINLNSENEIKKIPLSNKKLKKLKIKQLEDNYIFHKNEQLNIKYNKTDKHDPLKNLPRFNKSLKKA